jgi:hypothetical protein
MLLEGRTSRATGNGITNFLEQVPDATPLEEDRLPENYCSKF